jgi:hypothetical protein
MNNIEKPCDLLARALVDVNPKDLAVLTVVGGSTATSIDVNRARAAIAQWLAVDDVAGVVSLTACGNAKWTWFVRAPRAHRLVGARDDDVLQGVGGDAMQMMQFRAPHGIVLGRMDGVEMSAANVTFWRSVFERQGDGVAQRAVLVVPLVCRCHVSFWFVDKHTATRALKFAFALKATDATVPRVVQVSGVRFSVTHNWSPASRKTTIARVHAPPQAPAPTIPIPVRAVSVAHATRRVVMFHDAENCWIGPTASGVALHRSVVAHVRACVGGGSGDMRVEWNLVLRQGGAGATASDASFRPTRRAVEDLRDLGVTMIDAGQKDGGVDAAVKELMRQWLASWSDLTAAAQQTTVVVLISGDRDFAPELRQMQRAGVRVLLVSGANVRDSLASLVWQHSAHWTQIAN